METTALIVVDMQNDFMDEGALPVKGARKLVSIINSIVKQFGNRIWIVTTQDWHPLKTPHFDKWPVHCVAGSKGAELVAGLELGDKVLEFYKGFKDLDGYSAFDSVLGPPKAWGPTDPTTHGSLHGVLQRAKIQSLYVCGVATDHCVKATIKDGIQLGYHVVFIQNASMGVKPDTTAAAIKEFQDLGVAFTHIE